MAMLTFFCLHFSATVQTPLSSGYSNVKEGEWVKPKQWLDNCSLVSSKCHFQICKTTIHQCVPDYTVHTEWTTAVLLSQVPRNSKHLHISFSEKVTENSSVCFLALLVSGEAWFSCFKDEVFRKHRAKTQWQELNGTSPGNSIYLLSCKVTHTTAGHHSSLQLTYFWKIFLFKENSGRPRPCLYYQGLNQIILNANFYFLKLELLWNKWEWIPGNVIRSARCYFKVYSLTFVQLL